MHFLLALALAATTPQPAATPAAGIVSSGVTLGETAAQLVADRGQPMLAQGTPAVQLWMYFSPGGGSLEMVAVKRGYVTGVAVAGAKKGPPALPEDLSALGVHLGAPASTIPPAGKDDKPVTADDVKYTFRVSKDGSTISAITAAMTDDAVAKLPPQPSVPVFTDGSSASEAVVLHAASDQLGRVYEGGYMAGHDFCNPTGKWKLISRSTETDGGKSYDVLNAGCDNSNAVKKIYFLLIEPAK